MMIFAGTFTPIPFINPGIAFHTDWYSLDRIQLIYGRRFYSRAADPNRPNRSIGT